MLIAVCAKNRGHWQLTRRRLTKRGLYSTRNRKEKGSLGRSSGNFRDQFRDKLVIYYPNAHLFPLMHGANSQLAVDLGGQNIENVAKQENWAV